MKLKLKEIIWEITGQCNNKCSYCGSKEEWGKITQPETIKAICDNITSFPPEELDISGGDPTLVPYEVHEYIVSKLKSTKCKILINLKSFQNRDFNDICRILHLYSHVGISINTSEDIEEYKKYAFSFPHTIITNFNLTNIFLFKDIIKVTDNKLWQIQFTVYRDVDNPLAIYNNKEALAQMQSFLNETNKQNIIIADNANKGHCTAGLYTLGICANGDVVPCLSMRSWNQDLTSLIEGNLLNEDLKTLWIKKFHNYRFEDTVCCKDHCKNKILNFTPQNEFVFPDYLKNPLDTPPVFAYYAVFSEPQVTPVYATQVMAYAVKPFTTLTAEDIQTGTTITVTGTDKVVCTQTKVE